MWNLWLQKMVWGKFFFTPVFCCCFWIRDPGSEIRDPGWVKIRIRDKHPGSATLFYFVSSLKAIDEKIKIRIRNPEYRSGSVSNVTDTEHSLPRCQKLGRIKKHECGLTWEQWAGQWHFRTNILSWAWSSLATTEMQKKMFECRQNSMYAILSLQNKRKIIVNKWKETKDVHLGRQNRRKYCSHREKCA